MAKGAQRNGFKLSQKKANKKRKSLVTTRISVLIVENDKILLVKHRKGDREYWVLPGGRLEYGETFVECARREMQEETGLEIEPEKFLYLSEAIAPDLSRHIVNVYLKAKVIGGTMRLGDEPILAGLDYLPLIELEQTTLFPPIGKIICDTFATDSHRNAEPQIRYLGNLWA
jgi:ADP-ribose pyrophosphatase YjhB (NUDIX family)